MTKIISSGEDEMNPCLTQKLKLQLFQPIQLCWLKQTYCRFAIPDYCLIEHSLYGCEYPRLIETCITFKERRKGKREMPRKQT